jgi:hypothetical protein
MPNSKHFVTQATIEIHSSSTTFFFRIYGALDMAVRKSLDQRQRRKTEDGPIMSNPSLIKLAKTSSPFDCLIINKKESAENKETSQCISFIEKTRFEPFHSSIDSPKNTIETTTSILTIHDITPRRTLEPLYTPQKSEEHQPLSLTSFTAKTSMAVSSPSWTEPKNSYSQPFKTPSQMPCILLDDVRLSTSLRTEQTLYIPEVLKQLQQGRASYAAIRKLIRASKDYEDHVWDAWFLDMYAALEDVLLATDDATNATSDQKEDALVLLKHLLEHQLARFSPIIDRLLSLLFGLRCHPLLMISYASEDLWRIIFKHYESTNEMYEFLIRQLALSSLNESCWDSLMYTWSLLGILIGRFSSATLDRCLQNDLAPYFRTSICHVRTEVRKSLVDFLITCHTCLENALEIYLYDFTVTQRKLVQVYLDRKQS